MACQVMTTYFDSAHYDVDHKQAEMRQDTLRKNSSSRDLDEWEALNAEDSRDLTWGREKPR